MLSDNCTVNFWNELDEYKEKDSCCCQPQKDKEKINVNIICCNECKIYIKEARDGVNIYVKCKDDCRDFCSCCDEK